VPSKRSDHPTWGWRNAIKAGKLHSGMKEFAGEETSWPVGSVEDVVDVCGAGACCRLAGYEPVHRKRQEAKVMQQETKNADANRTEATDLQPVEPHADATPRNLQRSNAPETPSQLVYTDPMLPGGRLSIEADALPENLKLCNLELATALGNAGTLLDGPLREVLRDELGFDESLYGLVDEAWSPIRAVMASAAASHASTSPSPTARVAAVFEGYMVAFVEAAVLCIDYHEEMVPTVGGVFPLRRTEEGLVYERVDHVLLALQAKSGCVGPQLRSSVRGQIREDAMARRREKPSKAKAPPRARPPPKDTFINLPRFVCSERGYELDVCNEAAILHRSLDKVLVEVKAVMKALTIDEVRKADMELGLQVCLTLSESVLQSVALCVMLFLFKYDKGSPLFGTPMGALYASYNYVERGGSTWFEEQNHNRLLNGAPVIDLLCCASHAHDGLRTLNPEPMEFVAFRTSEGRVAPHLILRKLLLLIPRRAIFHLNFGTFDFAEVLLAMATGSIADVERGPRALKARWLRGVYHPVQAETLQLHRTVVGYSKAAAKLKEGEEQYKWRGCLVSSLQAELYPPFPGQHTKRRFVRVAELPSAQRIAAFDGERDAQCAVDRAHGGLRASRWYPRPVHNNGGHIQARLLEAAQYCRPGQHPAAALDEAMAAAFARMERGIRAEFDVLEQINLHNLVCVREHRDAAALFHLALFVCGEGMRTACANLSAPHKGLIASMRWSHEFRGRLLQVQQKDRLEPPCVTVRESKAQTSAAHPGAEDEDNAEHTPPSTPLLAAAQQAAESSEDDEENLPLSHRRKPSVTHRPSPPPPAAAQQEAESEDEEEGLPVSYRRKPQAAKPSRSARGGNKEPHRMQGGKAAATQEEGGGRWLVEDTFNEDEEDDDSKRAWLAECAAREERRWNGTVGWG
jgi:hypothetical protein